MSEPLVGNKAIEDAAIAFVKQREAQAGRTAKDTRYQGAAGDLESGGRIIEVKAAAKYVRSSGSLLLETRQVEEARTNPNFYVYVVENVGQGHPERFELRIIGGEQLQRLVARAKERRYFEVPLPVSEYDQLPNSLARFSPGDDVWDSDLGMRGTVRAVAGQQPWRARADEFPPAVRAVLERDDAADGIRYLIDYEDGSVEELGYERDLRPWDPARGVEWRLEWARSTCMRCRHTLEDHPWVDGDRVCRRCTSCEDFEREPRPVSNA